MTECYRCGQEGHTRAQCPGDAPLPPAAPARDRAAERWRRLPAPDPDIAHTWADVIRKTLGFPPPDEGDSA